MLFCQGLETLQFSIISFIPDPQGLIDALVDVVLDTLLLWGQLQTVLGLEVGAL